MHKEYTSAQRQAIKNGGLLTSKVVDLAAELEVMHEMRNSSEITSSLHSSLKRLSDAIVCPFNTVIAIQ
jgi:hypothetical protein